MTLNDRLGGFLDRALATGFGYGTHDCLLFPAEWVLEVTGIDVAAAWRGQYDSAIGAERILQKNGDLAALAETAMESHGFTAASIPELGDVGVVMGYTDEHALRYAGAICCGAGLWVVLSARGLIEARTDAVLAWSVTGYINGAV